MYTHQAAPPRIRVEATGCCRVLARRTAPTDSARAADKSARSTARVFTWQPHQDRDILCQQGAASRRCTGLLHPDPTQAADSQDKDSQRSVWTLRADTTLTCRVGQHSHTRLPCPDSRLAMDSKSNRQLLHVRALHAHAPNPLLLVRQHPMHHTSQLRFQPACQNHPAHSKHRCHFYTLPNFKIGRDRYFV